LGYGGYFSITVVSVLPAMLVYVCLWSYYRRAEQVQTD